MSRILFAIFGCTVGICATIYFMKEQPQESYNKYVITYLTEKVTGSIEITANKDNLLNLFNSRFSGSVILNISKVE